MSLWIGNHTVKAGASFTYDVTEQLFSPLQNSRLHVHGLANGGTEPVPVFAGVRAHARGAVDVSEGLCLRRLLQDDWRVRNNLTINLGLRYDVEIIKDIPDWPAGTE